MSRTRTPASLVACAALLLSACTGSGESDDGPAGPGGSPAASMESVESAEPVESPPPVVRDATRVEPVWSLELPHLGQPAVADGVALVLIRAPQRSVDLVAVDVVTGDRLWSREWSPGGAAPGFALEPQVFRAIGGETLTVLSEPGGGDFVEPLVALDLRTGTEVFRTERLLLVGPAVPCGDGLDVCVGVVEAGTTRARRLDLTTGDLLPDEDGPPAGGVTLGPAGIFGGTGRPGEGLGVRRDGETLWLELLAVLFGDGPSIETGWRFDHDPETDRYLGLLLEPLPADQEARSRTGRDYEVTLGREVLVGLEGATGEVLWRERGADPTCLGDSLVPEDSLPLARCRSTGRITYRGVRVQSSDDLAVTLEGMDVDTGETTWRIDLADDAARDVLLGRASRPISDGASAVVPTDDGDVLVDLATGNTSPAGDDTGFACTGPVEEFRYARAYPGAGVFDRRFGTPPVDPCLADGTPAPAFTVAALIEGAQPGDVDGDGLVVVARQGRLEGYRLPD